MVLPSSLHYFVWQQRQILCSSCTQKLKSLLQFHLMKNGKDKLQNICNFVLTYSKKIKDIFELSFILFWEELPLKCATTCFCHHLLEHCRSLPFSFQWHFRFCFLSLHLQSKSLKMNSSSVFIWEHVILAC